MKKRSGWIIVDRIKKIFDKLFILRYFNYPDYKTKEFVVELSRMARGKKVLDAGAGDCPYRQYFKNSTYISQDICDKDDKFEYKFIDIKSEIYKIPVKGSEFDFILCTDVLEHLRYPDKAFKEFCRILRKGGQLWLTSPYGGAEHEAPYNYFLFTRYALKALGEENNFRVIKIDPLGGRFISLAVNLKNLLPGLTENPTIYLLVNIVQFPLMASASLILYILDKLDKVKNWPPGYLAIYEKK